jgi:hypothetical protein
MGRASAALRAALPAAGALLVVALGFDLINAFPYGLTYDDGFFYAQIAYNLGEHGRSTFDGFNTTSGYHLLWGGLLGLVSGLIGPFTASKTAHLYAFEACFALLAVFAAWRYQARPLERFCAIAFVILGTLLMETLLLSCLLLAFARAETASETGGRRSSAWMAFLVPLTRIDATLILAVYAALVFLHGERQRALRVVSAAALGALAQVGLMLAIFGEPFSVSAAIKASNTAPFAWATLRASLLGPEAIALGYGVRAALFFGLCAVLIWIGVAERRISPNHRLLYLGLGAAAFSAMHFASQLIPFWCYLPAYLVVFYALTHMDLPRPSIARARSMVVWASALVGLLLVAHKIHIYGANLDVARGARDFVGRIKEHVPPRARIYQIDGSGFTGYFSERSVVNGDGLVNTYDYARRLREGRLAGILDEQVICYLVLNRRPASGPLLDFGGLRVEPDDVEEVMRSSTYGRFPTTDFVLYRRRVAGCRSAGSEVAEALRVAVGGAVTVAIPRTRVDSSYRVVTDPVPRH